MAIQLDPAEVPAATRVALDGSTERAEFRGEPGSRIFTYLHLPASTPRGAVAICSPLHGEFAKDDVDVRTIPGRIHGFLSPAIQDAVVEAVAAGAAERASGATGGAREFGEAS